MMTIEEMETAIAGLETVRDGMQEDVRELQGKLEEAKLSFQETGKKMPKRAFSDLNTALRNATVDLHDVFRKLKKLRTDLYIRRNGTSNFQRAAEILLDPTVYDSVMELAKSIQEENANNQR